MIVNAATGGTAKVGDLQENAGNARRAFRSWVGSGRAERRGSMLVDGPGEAAFVQERRSDQLKQRVVPRPPMIRPGPSSMQAPG